MIIDLPKNADFYRSGGQIKIEDGILKIGHLVSWREFIYKLTISTKGKRCWYCKKKLRKKDITMDHLYPQDLGGPTIPNNLAPTCAWCNSDKSNLTEMQYKQLRKANEKERSKIRHRMVRNNEKRKMKDGYFLPKKWITKRSIDRVLVTMFMKEDYKGKRYKKIEHFYEQYKKLPYPVIVDRNNYLLDGFLVLMFAKNHGINEVPTIVLENVEVVFK